MRVKLAAPNTAAIMEKISKSSFIIFGVFTNPVGTSVGTCHTSVVSAAPTAPKDTSVSEGSALRNQ
uniref:Uncharacterized protein n=1 Tax=Mesocestoides corti TaxID=53468 RepID=A0A5K3EGS2_MESCO